MTAYLFGIHQTGDKRDDMLGGQLVEDTREDQFSGKELISGADAAGNATLRVDDVLLRDEPETAQDTFHGLEVRGEQRRFRQILDLLLQDANVLVGGALLDEGIPLGAHVRVVFDSAVVIRVRGQIRFSRLNLPQQLGESFLRDLHVLNRIQLRDSFREPTNHLVDRSDNRETRIACWTNK